MTFGPGSFSVVDLGGCWAVDIGFQLDLTVVLAEYKTAESESVVGLNDEEEVVLSENDLRS